MARQLGLPFMDADEEIAAAAGASIPEIFATYGESRFREGERRVIARLLSGPPHVLATGGGAFIDPATRRLIAERGISIWLRASLDLLERRTVGRTSRPLLNVADPRAVLAELMAARDPIYAEADLVVDTSDEPADFTTRRVVAALAAHLASRTPSESAS
jgi:shikimate kinase